MNTNNLKKYAPQARRDFMGAVSQRLNQLGIASDGKGKLTVSTPVISGSVMQIEGMSFDANLTRARDKLVQRAERVGFEQLVEQMAYTWFNRLSAIRFMELHGYLDHNLRVLSHPEKANSFEILDHAQDVAADLGLDRNHIVELKLAGNQDEQLYRLLLLGQCHQLHQAMPFLFEALDDETELLLPDNLTRTDSILRGLVDSIPEDDWQNVEIIGWLYQFYISEKKDAVIGKVVKSEDIPAATQLFTPNWIVKYLVQNSVGRQWLMTYPDSGLKAQMEYYIEPAEQEPSVVEALAAITPTSIDPETLKVLDPACGSGHILVEAYDILKAIYEERGYRVRDIPKLILENNLYGLDIDDRAAQLAGFALLMKAREDDRRIFSRDIKLNVLAIQSTQNLDLPDLWRKLALNQDAKRGSMESIFDDVQSNLVDSVDDIEFKQLRAILALFEQAKTLGSLIQVPHEQAEYLRNLTNRLRELSEQGDLMQKQAANVLLPFVQQAWLLAEQYDVVVANPPYMGNKYLNPILKYFLKKNYNGFEKDLFSVSMVRNLAFAKETSQLGFMTPFVWMFIYSYENLRNKFINEATITSLIQPELHAFFDSAFVSICCFIVNVTHLKDYKSSFIRLTDFYGADLQPQKTLEAIKNPNCGWFYNAKPDDFKKISGSPIAYWMSEKLKMAFEHGNLLRNIAIPRQGLATMDNSKFTRFWNEISVESFSKFSKQSKCKWYPYNKGGDYRKWYGNQELVVNWENAGSEIKQLSISRYGSASKRVVNEESYFLQSVTWSKISSGKPSFRFQPKGAVFDVAGMSLFPSENETSLLLMLLNSIVSLQILELLSPTLNFEAGQIGAIPVIKPKNFADSICVNLIAISKTDWDNYETSWDFATNPLIATKEKNLATAYSKWEIQNRAAHAQMKQSEEENNRLFIEAYGLQDELTPEVPEDQITLTRADQEKDIQRLISYAIGCMMGRYRLDRPGLIYAHAGNVDFDSIYHAAPTPPFEKGGPGGILDSLQIPPNPPFSKGGLTRELTR